MLNIYHPRCLILPLFCNIFFLYQKDFFLPICCHKVAVHVILCFDSKGPTEPNEKVFDFPKELITTAKQVVFVYLNFLERMKISANMRLDMVVRNDIRTV